MNLFKRIGKWFQNEPPKKESNVPLNIVNELTTWHSPYYPDSSVKPYNPDKYVRKKGSVEVYKGMMCDEQVKAVIVMKMKAILSSGYEIQGQEDGKDKEIVDFINYCLKDGIENNFNKSLEGILSAMVYGFSISEKVYKRIEGGQYTGKIGLRYVKTKPAHSFELWTDDYGKLTNLKQWGATGNQIDISGDALKYFIVYSYYADNSDFGSIYGVSDLRAAYRYWWSKDITIRFLNIYSERFGNGIVQAMYPRGLSKDEILALEDTVNNITAKTGIVVPEGVAISVIESARAGQASFIETISMFDAGIAKSVLVPNLMGFTDIKTGTYNLGEKQFDLFMNILETIRTDLQEMINEQLIRQLVDFNYIVDVYPTFKFKPITKEDKEKLSNVFITAVEKGVIKETEEDEQYLREALKYPKRTDKSILMPQPEKVNPFNPVFPPKDKQKDKIEESEEKQFRQLNKYERKVDFKNLVRDLDDKEYDVKLELGKLITKMKDELISTIVRRKVIENKDFKEVNKLELKYLGDMRLMWKDILRKAYKQGGVYVKDLIPKAFASIPAISKLTPKEALAYFESTAFRLTGTERDFILNKIKPILFDAIKTGQNTDEVVYKLEEFFNQYEVLQRNSKGELEPIEEIGGRLNTVVRTNYMDAYNQGLMNMMKDAGDFVPAYQYSSVMDVRTTDICVALDGKIYKANNPIWNKITPPNHFNCRSIAVPVLNDEWTGEEDDLPDTNLLETGFGK